MFKVNGSQLINRQGILKPKWFLDNFSRSNSFLTPSQPPPNSKKRNLGEENPIIPPPFSVFENGGGQEGVSTQPKTRNHDPVNGYHKSCPFKKSA